MTNRKLSRREFLTLTGFTAAGLAVFPWVGSPTEAAASGDSLEGTGLSLPCAAGDVPANGAVIWFKAESECSILVEYGTELSFDNGKKGSAVRVSDAHDFTGKTLLRDLDSKTTYYYRALVADKKPGTILAS